MRRALALASLVVLAACGTTDREDVDGSEQHETVASPIVYFHGDAGLYPWNAPGVIQERYQNRIWQPAVDKAMTDVGSATGIVVVGYSYGRHPAANLAKRLGTHAKRLVLLDPVDTNAAGPAAEWGGQAIILCGNHDPSVCAAYTGTRCYYDLDHAHMFDMINQAAAWTGGACPGNPTSSSVAEATEDANGASGTNVAAATTDDTDQDTETL